MRAASGLWAVLCLQLAAVAATIGSGTREPDWQRLERLDAAQRRESTRQIREAVAARQAGGAPSRPSVPRRFPRPSRGQSLDPASYVDLAISTGGFGFGVGGDPPGPQIPFGAIRASPDTSADDLAPSFTHYGGYHYDDTHIRCFSQTHMVGPGASDWGNIGVMPVRNVDLLTLVDYG